MAFRPVTRDVLYIGADWRDDDGKLREQQLGHQLPSKRAALSRRQQQQHPLVAIGEYELCRERKVDTTRGGCWSLYSSSGGHGWLSGPLL